MKFGKVTEFQQLAQRADGRSVELCLTAKNGRLDRLFVRPKDKEADPIAAVRVPSGDVEAAALALAKAWR